MNWEEACNILGVQQTASLEEIDAQYRIKAFILHPDHTSGYPEVVRNKATEDFISAQKAYEFLKVPTNNPFSNPPKLKIEPTRIRFKDVEIGQKKTTNFQVNSTGGVYTNIWIDKQPAPWLTVTAVKSTGAEQLPLEVTIECNGNGEEDQHYSCNLVVRLENEKTHLKDEAIVQVELWEKGKLEEPSPDMAVNTTPAIPQPQVSQATKTEFSYKSFFSTLWAFSFLGFFPLAFLYGVLLDNALTIWWVLLVLYVGFMLWWSFKEGIAKGVKIKGTTNPAPSSNFPPPTKSPTYSSPSVVVNVFSSTYHRPSCEWAKKISHQNRRYMTRDEARQRGFKSCKVCRP